MAMRVSAAAMEGISTLYQWGAMGTWSDSQLVAQFLTGDDGNEAAFRVLIHRHGPMVLGVCRRVLGDDHAAEDAFQTTFLVLVEEGRVRSRTATGSLTGSTVSRCGWLTKSGSRAHGGGVSNLRRRGARRIRMESPAKSNCDR